MRKEHKIVASIVILILLSVVIYIAYTTSVTLMTKGKKLIIYTDDSFLLWGNYPEAVQDFVFKGFEKYYEREYGVKVALEIKRFEGDREMLSAVIQELERGVRTADVVIGLDNILVIEAIDHEVLESIDFTQLNNIENVPQNVIEAFDPTGHAIPLIQAIIGVVYDKRYASEEAFPELEKLKFETFYNETYASHFVVEDPRRSGTGLNFFIGQVVFFEKVLKKNWSEWWNQVKDNITVVPSWSDAYDLFLDPEETGIWMVVSTTTDPAYAYYFYGSDVYGAAVFVYNETKYGWFYVYGAGIVRGTKNYDIALNFLDWLLSPEVQSLYPLNDWMWPVNQLAAVPDWFEEYAQNPNEVYPINLFITQDEIRDNLDTWLEEWSNIMGAT